MYNLRPRNKKQKTIPVTSGQRNKTWIVEKNEFMDILQKEFTPTNVLFAALPRDIQCYIMYKFFDSCKYSEYLNFGVIEDYTWNCEEEKPLAY